MNEASNTQLIQKMYEAFGRGDVQTILDHLTPDAEWILEGPAVIPFAGRRVGPEQIREFFTALATTQTNQKLTIDSYVAQGDIVATIGRYEAVIKATGKHIDSGSAHFFTIRDGKVSKFVDFTDTAQAADAYTAASAATR